MGNEATKVATTETEATKTVNDEETTKVEEPGKAPEASKEDPAPASTEEKTEDKEGEEEWVPDYKFKVRDNIFEFAKELQPHVTKENHKVIKELHEKAYGLDYAKERLTKYDTQFQELNTKIAKLDQYENLSTQLDTMLEQGDFASFQKTLQIPDEMVMKRAVEILKLREMPPEEKQQYERYEQNQAKVYTLEQQTQAYQKVLFEQAIQSRQAELDNALTSTDIVSVANEFDAQAGKPGAFKERVWDYGALIYKTQGKDLSVKEAIEGFMNYAGIKLGSKAAAPAQNQQTAPVVNSTPKETIPNIKSSGKAPARKVYTSIADLKEAAKNLPVG